MHDNLLLQIRLIMGNEKIGSFFGVIAIALAMKCSVSAIDSNHMRYMCNVQGNKTIRPWTEKNVTGPCTPWTETCCSNDDSLEIENGQRVKLDQCGEKMSEKCRRHFERKLCFQYCSPYIGPWLLNHDESRRNTKFRFVPLCRSQCELWWQDCKDDMAFTENWTSGPDKWGWDECETIESKYNDSTYFCEHAFGPFEFLVVSDEDNCMVLFGDLRNDEFVARIYSERIKKSGMDHLYGNVLLYQKSMDETQQNDKTPKNEDSMPQPKYIALFFLLGALISALASSAACILIPKCKTKHLRTVSRTSLVPNDEADEERAELGMSP